MKSLFRLSLSAFMIVLVLSVAGCGKKATAPTSSTSTAPTVAQPTAHITASPTSVLAGDAVELSWTTTDATSANIDGIGVVQASGKRTMSISESTTFRLVAKGDGGTAEDTVRVTVNRPQVQDAPAISESEEQQFKATIEDIFYGYDAYTVDEASAAILAKDAAFLSKHQNIRFTIGGYCDERGSNEYNLALGQNRAESAKKALVAAGISPNRIRVISYGKEKPFCSEASEECWAKNRRAGFTLDK